MKITKFGQSCFLAEESGARILFDPGSYSTLQNEVKSIDLIIITHEHQDHLSLDSLKVILKNNPDAIILTNKSVGKILDKENIEYIVVENGQNYSFKGILIEAFGDKHAEIHSSMPGMANTGYFINNKLFSPGDAFINPKRPIEILALPVIAPWSKISEVIDYGKELMPKVCFPVHDAMITNPNTPYYRLPSTVFEPLGIKFIVLEAGKEKIM